MVIEEATSVRAVVANLQPGFSLLVRTPILRSTLIVFAPVLFAFGLWNVLLLPFAIGARRHRVPVRPPGRPDVARLRLRQPADGQVHRPPAGGHLDGHQLPVMGVVGVLYGLATSNIGRDRPGHDLRVRPTAVVDRPRPGPPAEHAARVPRPRLLRVLRLARRAVPDRHGHGRPGRRPRHPAARHRRVADPDRVGGPDPALCPASAGRRPNGGGPRSSFAPPRRRRGPEPSDPPPCSTSTSWPCVCRHSRCSRNAAPDAARVGPTVREARPARRSSSQATRRPAYFILGGSGLPARRTRTARTARCRRWARATSSARSPR